MKRILSLFLSLALLLTLLTASQVGALTAHAHDAEDAPETEASAVSEQPGEEDASAEPAPVPEEAEDASASDEFIEYQEYIWVDGRKTLCTFLRARNVDHSRYQLPDELLTAPTEELIDALLQHELMWNFWVHNCFAPVFTIQTYEGIRDIVNGVQELETRPDAASTLLRMLEQEVMHPEKNTAAKYIIWPGKLLEIPFYRDQLTQDELSRLEELLGVGMSESHSTEEITSASGGKLNAGVDEPMASTAASEVVTLKLSNGQEIRYVSSGTDRTYTTSGSTVKYHVAQEEMEADFRAAMTFSWESLGVSTRGTATTYYNCHSYAWNIDSNSRRTWIGLTDYRAIYPYIK